MNIKLALTILAFCFTLVAAKNCKFERADLVENDRIVFFIRTKKDLQAGLKSLDKAYSKYSCDSWLTWSRAWYCEELDKIISDENEKLDFVKDKLYDLCIERHPQYDLRRYRSFRN